MRLYRTPRFFRRIFPRMTWGFSRQVNAVYLTFDDGPDPLVTPWVLDELKKRNAKATFFCVGNQVRKYPELFERIKHEGHVVGNHTMNHENGRKTKTDSYLGSIDEADKLISSTLFRPPYGSMTTKQAKDVTDAGYKIIMWSWLTYDFDEKVATDEIIRSTQNVRSGDIVVLHDNPKCVERLKMILPKIMDSMIQKGFELKPIE